MSSTLRPEQFKPQFAKENVNDFWPGQVELRTKNSGMELLGTSFMTFDQPGKSDPWTVQYDETVFVLKGRAEFVIVSEDGDMELTADQDELIVLPKGTTVRYGAEPGTRLLLSIAPANWREKQGQ